jgi:hypothetical protein
MGKYLKFLSLAFLCFWWPSGPSDVSADLHHPAFPKHQLGKHIALNVQHSVALIEEETDEADEHRETTASYEAFASILFPGFLPESNIDRTRSTQSCSGPPRFILFHSIIV